MLSLSIDDVLQGSPHLLSEAEHTRLQDQLTRMVYAAWLSDGCERELEVDLRFTGDESMRVLNRDYRGKDKTTDVLAFSQREGEGDFAQLSPEILGDIVISLDTAYRQRAEHGGAKTLFAELVFLVAHGLCHLLGYDHQDDEEELAMNTRMDALIAESERTGSIKPA